VLRHQQIGENSGLISHGYSKRRVIKNPWSGQEEAKAILIAELAALLPSLAEKGVTIPDTIRRYAAEAVTENVLSAQVREAREAFRQRMLGNQLGSLQRGIPKPSLIGNQNAKGNRGGGAPIGNQNAKGHPGPGYGNTNGRGNKGKTTGKPAPNRKANWSEENTNILIDAFKIHGNQWAYIRRQYLSRAFDEDATNQAALHAMKNRLKFLKENNDPRVANLDTAPLSEETPSQPDMRKRPASSAFKTTTNADLRPLNNTPQESSTENVSLLKPPPAKKASFPSTRTQPSVPTAHGSPFIPDEFTGTPIAGLVFEYAKHGFTLDIPAPFEKDESTMWCSVCCNTLTAIDGRNKVNRSLIVKHINSAGHKKYAAANGFQGQYDQVLRDIATARERNKSSNAVSLHRRTAESKATAKAYAAEGILPTDWLHMFYCKPCKTKIALQEFKLANLKRHVGTESHKASLKAHKEMVCVPCAKSDDA
jgi:hypothetical protein